MAGDVPNYPQVDIATYRKTQFGTVIAEYSSTGLSMRKARRPGFISLVPDEIEVLRKFLNDMAEMAEKERA